MQLAKNAIECVTNYKLFSLFDGRTNGRERRGETWQLLHAYRARSFQEYHIMFVSFVSNMGKSVPSLRAGRRRCLKRLMAEEEEEKGRGGVHARGRCRRNDTVTGLSLASCPLVDSDSHTYAPG